MFIFKKKYFFIIGSIKDIDLKNIKNFGKYSIIYRSNSPENIDKLKKFRLECKIHRIPFFVANNIDLIKALKADGLYISAYNKNLSSNYLRDNFKIINTKYKYPDKKNRGKFIREFLDSIIDNKSLYPSKKDIFNLMTACFYADLSARHGKEINIKYFND